MQKPRSHFLGVKVVPVALIMDEISKIHLLSYLFTDFFVWGDADDHAFRIKCMQRITFSMGYIEKPPREIAMGEFIMPPPLWGCVNTYGFC